jgi:hypothetical protein
MDENETRLDPREERIKQILFEISDIFPQRENGDVDFKTISEWMGGCTRERAISAMKETARLHPDKVQFVKRFVGKHPVMVLHFIGDDTCSDIICSG